MIKKLSLAAIVAMTSVSFANAANIADSVSGKLEYELQKVDSEEPTRETKKAVFKFGIKVDDKLTLNTRIVSKATGTGEHYLYGTYTGVANTTILAGLTPLLTPFTDNSDDYGDGAIVLYKVSDALTVGGAAFVNATINNGAAQLANNVYALTAKGAAGPVNYELWYVNLVDVVDSAISANVSANVAGFDIAAEYAVKTPTAGDDQTTFGVSLSGSAAALSYSVGFIGAGTDGGNVQIGSDNSFMSAGEESDFTANGTSAIYATVGYDVSDAVSVGADVVSVSADADADASTEIVLRAGYKYNKSLSMDAFYSIYDLDANDDAVSTANLDIVYKF